MIGRRYRAGRINWTILVIGVGTLLGFVALMIVGFSIDPRELETDVLDHKAMAPVLKPFLKLRLDATEQGPEVEAWMARFDIAGLPTVLVFNADGTENKAARIAGYLERDAFKAKIATVQTK